MKYLKVIFQIFLKEIKEGLRDPKTILFTYLLPLVIYPLFFIWVAEVAAVQVESVRSEKLSVLFSGAVPNELRELIKKQNNLVVTDSSAAVDSQVRALKPNKTTGSELRKTLQDEKASAIFRCESFDVQGSAEADIRCSIYYDQSNERSVRVRSQLTQASESYQKEAREHRLKTLRLSEELITPFVLTANDTAGVVRSTNKTIGNVIPMLLIMILYLCSFYPALNSTVGERERGTYATLLTLPIDPSQLVSGKFLAVLFFCFAGLASYIIPPWVGSYFVPQSAYDKMQSFTLYSRTPQRCWLSS